MHSGIEELRNRGTEALLSVDRQAGLTTARLAVGQARLAAGQARLAAGQARLAVGQARLAVGQGRRAGREKPKPTVNRQLSTVNNLHNPP